MGSSELWLACRYENLVQVRCLLEGVGEDDILQHWHTILPDSMQRWQLDRQEVRCFPPVVFTAVTVMRQCPSESLQPCKAIAVKADGSI